MVPSNIFVVEQTLTLNLRATSFTLSYRLSREYILDNYDVDLDIDPDSAEIIQLKDVFMSLIWIRY